jgi:AraC-like DNA-binding protein
LCGLHTFVIVTINVAEAAIRDLRSLGDSHSHITTLTRDYDAGHVIPLHFHDRDQLVYASRGVMTVRTSDGTWVVPTYRAVWIPAAVLRTITMSGTVAMRTLYLKPRLARAMPRDCCVVNVRPLLRELILHACAFAALKKTILWQRHLIDVIIDQLETIQMVPLQLPNPSDPRALRIAQALLTDPSESRPLQQLCKVAGAGKRTVERLFLDDVGITFGKWRQQLRLMRQCNSWRRERWSPTPPWKPARSTYPRAEGG